MTTRDEVFEAINGERDYQDSRWNEDTTTTEGNHTVTEWLVFMQDYLTEAIHVISRNADPQATQDALNIVRKITTMGVACMEQQGAPPRGVS